MTRNLMPANLVASPALGLGTVVLLLAIASYYPFAWDPPRTVRNDVVRTPDGALRFGVRNAARTPGTPEWLQDARSSGSIRVRLEVRPAAAQTQPSAAMMMLARDYWRTDFALGQWGSDLLVWLRRPGSTENGDPYFAVAGALTPQRWTSVELAVRAGEIVIEVDGVERLRERLPPDALRSWEGGRVALGDEVNGGRPWQGEIRRAELRTPGHVVDYVTPGALSIPETFRYFPDHVAPSIPSNRIEWAALCLHFASFVPVGFFLVRARRPPLSPRLAILISIGIAAGLAAGKVLFHGRHTTAADVAMQAVGAFLGATFAGRAGRRPLDFRGG